MGEHFGCTGAILIGGRSSRMGSPKHEMRLSDGRSMCETIATELHEACGKVVWIGADGPERAGNFVFIKDQRPGLGPLGGIEALLSSGIDSHYVVCPCDVPLITADLLRWLLKASDAAATVFQIEDKGLIEPLPVRISAEALPAVREMLDAGERSAWRLMEELRPDVVSITAAQAKQLHNVNTPEDYCEAVRMLGNV